MYSNCFQVRFSSEGHGAIVRFAPENFGCPKARKGSELLFWYYDSTDFSEVYDYLALDEFPFDPKTEGSQEKAFEFAIARTLELCEAYTSPASEPVDLLDDNSAASRLRIFSDAA